jgi:chemotaxis protein MotA
MLVVLGAIVGGYLMERGNLLVLLQPAELVIIGGAALGTLLIANPLPVVLAILKGMLATVAPSRFNGQLYLATLTMLNDLFQKARKGGMANLESDVEQPEQSEIFQKYPLIAKDHAAMDFICDTLRIVLAGNISAFELDQILELDVEVHHKETSQPAAALVTLADALPGLGIVAAVLGVVITMGALGGPPSEIGQKVAAALVGTFLGILLCYGFFSPFAVSMHKASDAEEQYFNCIRVALLSFIKGASPLVALEFARRSIPHGVRPAFKDMESALRGRPAEQPVAA